MYQWPKISKYHCQWHDGQMIFQTNNINIPLNITISTQKLTPSSLSLVCHKLQYAVIELAELLAQSTRWHQAVDQKPTTLVLKRCQWNFIYFECSYLFVEKGRGTVRFVRGGDRKTLEGKRSCHLRQEKQGPWEEVGFTKRKFNLSIAVSVI